MIITSPTQVIRLKNARYWMPDELMSDSAGILHGHDLILKNEIIFGTVPYSQHYECSANETMRELDLNNALVTPGLIDCHTHLVFGGNRSHEWERRLAGESYESIINSGGGIVTTVNATRKSSFNELLKTSQSRLEALKNEGVTSIEIKSGYGLDYENERKILEVIKALKEHSTMEVVPTFLGAHAVPYEYKGRTKEYLDTVIHQMLPDFWKQGLFEAVDIFCETIAFSLEEGRALFLKAKELGIPIKAHAEQLSHLGTSALVASFDGLSVDHIEYLEEKDIQKMQGRRTVATLLPLAFYFLKETKRPPIELLRQYKIPMAISTDFNPGTAPLASLRLAMNMAAVQFGLTVEEIMKGVTSHAAKALNKENSIGQIAPGFLANLAIWSVDRPVDIFYELGTNPLVYRVYQGKFEKMAID